MKFDQHLDIHMKIILYDWIDHLKFENEEPIHNTDAIHAMYSIIAQVCVYIYILKNRKYAYNNENFQILITLEKY
jgi:hypothetical protein